MRIQYMRELIAIKEQGNYSRAAKSLYVTQPVLSRHIADMEKELGVKLLNRNKHTVELTEVGMKVYLRFQRIVQNYDVLLQDVANFKTGITGTLRLECCTIQLNRILAPCFQNFQTNIQMWSS